MTVTETFVIGTGDGQYTLTPSGKLTDTFFGKHKVNMFFIGNLPVVDSVTQNIEERTLSLAAYGSFASGTIILVSATPI